MATTRTSFAICILLSLATIAFSDYYAPSSPPVYTSPANKPTLSPPVYTPPAPKPTLPPPVYTPIHKPILPPPVYKPTLSPPVYTKPSIPRPVYTPPANKPTLPPPVYTPPVYKLTPSPPVYTKPTLPPVYKPTLPPPVYKKSPSSPYVPKTTYTPSTKPQHHPEIIKAVGGFILCKNGYKTYPIQGAKAKIVCFEIGSYGNGKNEVMIYSDPSNSKGYFHVVLTHIKDLSYCRVKLYTSPVESCKNPTNVNKGLTGFPLSMYSKKNSKLFNIGSFYFTGPKAAPTTPKY